MLLGKLSRFTHVFSRAALVSLSRTVSTCQTGRSVVLCNSCQASHQYIGAGSHTTVASELRKGSPIYNMQSVRFYMRKKTIRIPPTKPLAFDYSGDLNLQLSPIDPNATKPGYEDVEELKSADKDIKAIFSMAFADGTEIKEKRWNELLAAIQEHPVDVQSLEVQIAKTTFFLRNQMRHVLDFRKDKVAKTLLVKRIHSRNRKLRLLRTYDMEKFEWLLRELKIKYVPKKTINDYKLVSKRAARKKAARSLFFDSKKQKLVDLKVRLEAERKMFEQEKEEELSSIATELEAMGITELDSVESVLEAIGMEKYIEKPEKRMKRRYLILATKFLLHKESERAKKAAANAASL